MAPRRLGRARPSPGPGAARLARSGPKLEREQVLLGRFVDIGAEIFAMLATCSRAQAMLDATSDKTENVLALADYFCTSSAGKVNELFRALRHNADRQGYKLAQKVLEGGLEWLEQGMV